MRVHSGNNLEGEISAPFFALLCDLDRFDFSGSHGIDQKLLAGHLACTSTNLKNQTRIDASNKGLRGSSCVLCLISSTRKLTISAQAQYRRLLAT